MIMFRIIELLGLLAPVAAGILLIRYRQRSRTAFGWGITGCVLAALASGIGVVGERASVVLGLGSGAGVDGMLEQMGTWAWVRFLLLVVGVALLVVAALVHRREGHRPTGWIVGGVVLAAVGVGVRALAAPDIDREWLTVMVELGMETVEAALLGLGVFLLAVAAMANRAGPDTHPEPTVLARRAGMAAWHLYTTYRGGRHE